ncbi:MAG: 3-hydroxyacyl-CoA dehydrogenase family protein [Cyclobacteriaceae bacterium]|jgi:3-hydroxybutyryl-CoA dehydrogenase
MKIGIRGDEHQYHEVSARLGEKFRYVSVTDLTPVVYDLLFDFRPTPDQQYPDGPAIFVDVMKYPLSAFGNSGGSMFGFCGWPGFFSRPAIEVCLPGDDHLDRLTELAKSLAVEFLPVNDQVGLVAPRVVAMIINEAHMALDEEIATRQDIDVAMKLGTGYPFGPFEWCGKIGAGRVVDLLQTLCRSNPHRYVIARSLLAQR